MTQNVNFTNPPSVTGAYVQIGDNDGIASNGAIGQLDKVTNKIIKSYAQVLFSEKKDGWFGTYSKQTAIARKDSAGKTVVDIYNDGANPLTGAVLSRTITYNDFQAEMKSKGKSFQESTI